MLRAISLFLVAISLTSCAFEKLDEDKGKGPSYRLPDTDLVFTSDKLSPNFNQLLYTVDSNPHYQIERQFRAANSRFSTYLLTNLNLQSDQCQKGGLNYLWYVVRGGSIVEVFPGAPFLLNNGEQLRVVIENPGACRSIRLRFVLINSQV